MLNHVTHNSRNLVEQASNEGDKLNASNILVSHYYIFLALEPCLEQPQIFQIFQKLGWRREGEIL